MPDHELKLNGLSRYTKQSPRLVLEEYSHCEVPAGCGGVVLRWRNPDQPIPMLVRCFSLNGSVKHQRLDGEDTYLHSKLLVSYGVHVLSLVIHHADPQFALVLLSAALDPQYARILQPEGDTTLLSLPDDTWRYTLEEPQDSAWQQPDFDDAAWTPLVDRPIKPASQQERRTIDSWTQELLDAGARPLGLDPQDADAHQMGLPAVSVRKRFQLTQRQAGGQTDVS
jgi:hypothetical protein